MMPSSWVLSLLLLILPACLHKPQAQVFEIQKVDEAGEIRPEINSYQEKVEQECEEDSVDYRINALSLEAKYSDIPIPLGSEPLPDFFKQIPSDKSSANFGYMSKMDARELYNYFKTEFLRLGWSFIGGMHGVESILTFEKPDRVCSVSLRPLDASNAFIIMVYPRKKA